MQSQVVTLDLVVITFPVRTRTRLCRHNTGHVHCETVVAADDRAFSSFATKQ